MTSVVVPFVRQLSEAARVSSPQEFMELLLPEGYGELRTFVKDGETSERGKLANNIRQFVKIEKGVVTEPHKVDRYLKACKQHKFNAYVATASRSREGALKKSGKASDCQALGVLFLDLDFKNELGEKGTRELLAKFPVQPSFTGRIWGRHSRLLAHSSNLLKGSETVRSRAAPIKDTCKPLQRGSRYSGVSTGCGSSSAGDAELEVRSAAPSGVRGRVR